MFIILEVQSATRTKENREVYSYKVADPTAAINCSIWDDPGKLLVPGDIVKLTKGYASVWRGSLTLYSGKSGEIYRMGDFCMVFNEQINMSEPIPASSQQNQVQGNHISVNNGNGGNGRAVTTTTSSTSNSVAPIANANNNGNKTKSPANAPSKSYVRKPINKK